MIKKILNTKIGTFKTDKIFEQYSVWIGSLVFFILIVNKIPKLEISEYQLIIGVVLTTICLMLGLIAGYVIGNQSSKK